ncbi:MAG: DNA replication/repair protein RecF [Chloroflexi bacterium]|nr:DNA replication/repair protein RecF [Chloroflexota bacterium]
MRLSRLAFQNFRNYPSLELDLPPGTILLVGDNAQGKTNFLEGIYYLATATSPRAEKDLEIVRWGSREEGGFTAVRGEVQGRDAVELEILLLPENEGEGLAKRIRIAGVRKRPGDLWGLLPLVLFMPQDVEIVAGPPALRRRFLDTAISQIEPGYFRSTQEYERVLTQRNHLLKRLRDGRGQRQELEFWDEKLAEVGSLLLYSRARFIAELGPIAQSIHHQLSGGETLALVYQAGGLKEPATVPVAIEVDGPVEPAHMERKIRVGLFQKQLESLYPQEVERGVSLYGPHRDEVLILANGTDLNIYGSRGQQRTAALTLKLAQAQHLRAKKEQPLLLLDDVFSELDERRRDYLSHSLAGEEQVFITTTSLHFLPAELQKSALLLQVVAGTIRPYSPDSRGQG